MIALQQHLETESKEKAEIQSTLEKLKTKEGKKLYRLKEPEEKIQKIEKELASVSSQLTSSQEENLILIEKHTEVAMMNAQYPF